MIPSFLFRLTLMRQTAYILKPTVLHGSNIMLHIRCFSPNVHLRVRHNRLCLHEYLHTVILCICVYLLGSYSAGNAFMRALQMRVSVLLSENVQL